MVRIMSFVVANLLLSPSGNVFQSYEQMPNDMILWLIYTAV